MIVKEAMTRPVVTVLYSASIRQAVHVLYEHEITTAPVVDETGCMVGMVTEMDLLRGEFAANPATFPRSASIHEDRPSPRVEDVMTTVVHTAEVDTDLAEVARLMMSAGLSGVPVLRADRIVGIVCRRDLMRVLSNSDARVRDDVLVAIRNRFPTGPYWNVTVRDGVVHLEGTAGRHAARAVDVLARTVPGVARVAVVDVHGGSA